MLIKIINNDSCSLKKRINLIKNDTGLDNMNELIEQDSQLPTGRTASSFGSYWFWYQFATGVFDVYLFYYYEAVLNLNVWLIALAFMIFITWDAINEPLLGHLTDRNTKFTRKWGKRFIWIILGSILGVFTFMMLFIPPNVDAQTDPLPIFIWLIISTCLYDTTLTISALHATGLFVDKFRSDKARRKAQSYIAPISLLALPIGAMIPPMIIEFENRDAFILLGIVSGIILLISALLSIYGVREDKEIIDRYYEVKKEPEKFMASLKSTLKQRSFMVYAFFFFGYFLIVLSIQASVPYIVNYVLQGDEMDITFIMAGLIVGALVSIPVWAKLTKKLNNNKKAVVIGSVILIVASFVVALFVDLITLIIFTTFFGFAMGAFWYLDSIVLSDVLDERSVIMKSDQKGTTLGIREFIARLPRAVMVLIFAIVHTLTGFASDHTNPAAQIGIRLHMTIIPALIFIVFVVIFWKFYPLTTEKLNTIKEELKELKI